ncbi:MAG: right-handed parallel beta-helix repeat-containing protein [Roseobacter sp.]
MLNISASNVTATLDPSETVLSVDELTGDERSYSDFFDQVSILTNEGFRYAIVPPSSDDFDIATIGGVKLHALPDAVGRISARQLGISGGGDERLRLRKLISTLRSGRSSHILIDVDVDLSGVGDGLVITRDDVPEAATIEFQPECRLLFDTDGTNPHDYLRVEDVSNLTLVRPQVVNTVPGTKRHHFPGIFLKNCDDCTIIEASVINTCGAGIIMENSRRCTVRDSVVEGVLADGFHITNGQTGPSLDCWTYNCVSRNTGDDGFAIVSYQNGGAPACERCGHVNFYSHTSGARGAALVGGRFCTIKGEAWQSNGPGLIVNRDDAYNSYGVEDSDVDVIARECGMRIGAAGIEIGAGCNGVSGSLRSYGSANRGVAIASPTDPALNIDVAISVKQSGSDGIYVRNVVGLNMRSAAVYKCAGNGLVVRDTNDVVISNINIREYGTADAANRGLTVQNCDTFYIASGLLLERSGQSERPIRINASRNGVVEAQQKVGGSAESAVQITYSCQSVFYNGETLRSPNANFALECQHFGVRTTTELKNSAIAEIAIPPRATTELPIGVPAHIINETGATVSVVGWDNVQIRGQASLQPDAFVTVTQVRPDVWYLK